MKSKRRKYEVALTFAVICATLAFLSISIGCVSAGSSFTQQNNNKSALSASWTTEAVDAPKYFTGFSQRAIAIDGFNRHISYYDYTNDDLKYATNASGSWVTSTIASEGDVGWYSSIAIDSNNKVHISYYDETNGELKYATDASGSWVTSTIDSVGCLEHHYISSSISIAIDSNNKVHIIYCDYANEALKYATNASGAWVTSTIDSEGEVLHSSIAIDSNNKVHISYRKYGSLKYATNASGAWVTSTIALGGRCTSIAIDSNNKVHIIYYSTSTYSYYLKYATNASGSWVTSTIDWRTGSTYITGGSSSSIAIDSNNKVHISYQDLPIETLDLKYATDASGSWVTSTIDSVGSVGEYSSIAIDSNNKVHISYQDGTNGDLKYATDASGSWVTSTIDSVGYVGMHTSVDIDSNNNVHISYYDSTNKDLKYATNSVSYPAPDISVSPVSFDFGDKCEGDTDSTTFELWNSGTGTLTYALSESCGWVEVNPTSGSSTGEHDTITVDIDTTGLSEGSHTCDISISSNGGTGMFTVRVNIVPKPDLIITEKWLCWPDNCTICYNVTNTGDGTAPACHNTTLYVDGAAVAYDHVLVDLAPGESYTGCFNGYVWTYTPPSDNITVGADNNETLDELDENNNCLTNIWMCGDVTGDGRVRTSDGRRIFRHLTFGDIIDNLWAADVTGDGRVRTSDGRRIFRHLTFGDPLNCNCSG